MIRNKMDGDIKVNVNMKGGDGTVTVTNLLKQDQNEFYGKGRLFGEIELPVGASIGKHTHEGEMECFYVIAGKGAFDDNGVVKEVSAGDVCYTGSGSSHAIRNTGDETLRLIALILYQ